MEPRDEITRLWMTTAPKAATNDKRNEHDANTFNRKFNLLYNDLTRLAKRHLIRRHLAKRIPAERN